MKSPRVLTQAGGTRLEYAFRLPESAELRFSPRLVRGSGVFRVGLQVEGEPARERFELALARGERRNEVAVALPGPAGHPALLVLEFQARPEGADAVGEWTAPRVLGRRPVGGDDREEPVALTRLRRRLDGTSVLLIVLDAAAARHFGCYGYDRNTTPEIDRIAAEAVVLDRAYSTASYTSLAMASLWTSQHPEQHHHGRRPAGPLPEGRAVLPELLRDRGVVTAAFLGNLKAGRPSGLERGFDQVWPLRLASKRKRGAEGPSSLERIDPVLNAAGRSFTYLHYLEPHFPYDPPPPFDTLFGIDESFPSRAATDPAWFHAVNRGALQPREEDVAHLVRLYDGNLAAVDHEIGALRRRLEESGRWEELLVIVTADHGEEFLEHGRLTHAAQVYEESVRIPLIVKLPGPALPQRHDAVVDLVDLGATLADVFGLTPADTPRFQGRSLLPLLAGGTLTPRPVLARSPSERPTYGLVDGWLKVVHDPRRGTTELYDLRHDPGETRDLASERPVTAEQQRQDLYRWLRDLDRGPVATGAEPELSPEDREALRALGYLD